MERSGGASSAVGAEGTLPCHPPGKHRWNNVPSSPRPMLLSVLSLSLSLSLSLLPVPLPQVFLHDEHALVDFVKEQLTVLWEPSRNTFAVTQTFDDAMPLGTGSRSLSHNSTGVSRLMSTQSSVGRLPSDGPSAAMEVDGMSPRPEGVSVRHCVPFGEPSST